MEITLESVFASRKIQDSKKAGQVTPGTFQVSAKIDEESRKDNRLLVSFLLTLSEPKSLVTYEFRGSCVVIGSPADFDGMMAAAKGGESRLPKILDAIYQRVYPAVFVLAGLTSSSYPQSTTLAAESVTGNTAEIEEPAPRVADDEKPVPAEEAKPATPRRNGQKVKRKAIVEEKAAVEEKPVVEEKPAEVGAASASTEEALSGTPALPQGH